MKIMKRSLIIFVALISCFSMTSCEKFLESRDKSSVLEDKLFTNREGFEEALYGIYGLLGTQPLYGAYFSLLPEGMGQGYRVIPESNNIGIFQKVMLHMHSDDGPAGLYKETWTTAYKVISDINKILEHLDNWTGKPLKYGDIYRGECLGLRAFLSFDLLRSFASVGMDKRGIPYVDKYGMYVTAFGTTKDCYRKIIDDLKKAESLLAEDENFLTWPRLPEDPYNAFMSDRECHFNLYAAKAALARVYWQRNQPGDLDSAAVYAEQVIESGVFPLPTGELVSSDYFIRMMSGTISQREAIFGIYKEDTYTDAFNMYMKETSAYVPADKNMYDIETGKGFDKRRDWIRVPHIADKDLQNKYGERFHKLVSAVAFNIADEKLAPVGINGVNVIRIPEMYLIVAEANLEKNPKKALDAYNTFVVSRGLVQEAGPVTQEMIEKQVYLEFVQEGYVWYRLKRAQVPEIKVESSLAEKSQDVIKMNESTWNWRIPDGEFEFRPEGSY